MNPLYVTGRYLSPSFCWFIICVQQPFQLRISIANRQTIGKIYLVIIESIWILVKGIHWSLWDGISHEKIHLRRVLHWFLMLISLNQLIEKTQLTENKIFHPRPFSCSFDRFYKPPWGLAIWFLASRNKIFPWGIWIFPMWFRSSIYQSCIVKSTSLISRFQFFDMSCKSLTLKL